ncbi:MAG: hypothetical protein JNL02_01300 [Saprospiraceae bacterium]|nr:hypothetical protein [Saprospiraceae bacterium]
MTENKLFDLFSQLSGPEKRECSAFLNSAYFNRRNDVCRLWEYLLESPEPNVPDAYGFAYPGVAFDDLRWRHLQSFLLARIENFLAQRAWEQHPVEADLQLASVYRRKFPGKPLDHVLRRAGTHLDKMPRDNEYYHLLYRLEWEKYASMESRGHTRDNNLAAVGRALDVYLLGAKLRLACLMESHRTVFNTDFDTRFLPLLLQYLDGSELLQEPIVALYYHCYRSLSDGRDDDFQAFRRELERQNDFLPAEERRIFLLLAINYCIRRLNTGEPRYIQEAFDLYQVGLETGILLENEHISRFAFKNIAALGLRLERYDWVQGFIDRYGAFLEEKHREANRRYNQARLHFARKEYERAMPLLAQVDESDLMLNLDSRVMLLKMYYETGEWDALDALIASFKIFLLRKKKSLGYHQAHYLNILRFVQKLTRLRHNDRRAVAALRSAIQQQTALIEKDWLLEMLD